MKRLGKKVAKQTTRKVAKKTAAKTGAKKAAAKKTASKKTAAKKTGAKKTAAKKIAAKPAPARRAQPGPFTALPPARKRAVDTGHYSRMLKGVGALSESAGGLEGFELAGPAPLDLSGGAIDERVETAGAELRRIVRDYLGDKPELYEIAEVITKSAKPALAAMRDTESLADENALAGLEVIVRTDGSRPSFMVRNGAPDTATSPIGTWGETLADSAGALRDAIACIGRIDDPASSQGFQGTGVLVQKDLVMTNRHVLQAIARQKADGSWKLNPNVAIDFGHEFRATETLRRRAIKRVVFAGAKPIAQLGIDHAKLDLALLELDPGEAPDRVLGVDLAPDWGQPNTGVFIIGYPGNPGAAGGPPSLLEQLFKSTFGHKRLAPGLITTASDRLAESPRDWTLGHDGTTLGGNSGSAVVVVGRETIAAGLHYGGTRADPRENWCHVLGLTLGETDGRSSQTLQEHFQERGVELIDRL